MSRRHTALAAAIGLGLGWLTAAHGQNSPSGSVTPRSASSGTNASAARVLDTRPVSPASRPARSASRPAASRPAVVVPPENMKRRILFVGSSTIAQWAELERDMAPLQVARRGIGGQTIAFFNRTLEENVLAWEPRVVVLYAGDNDIASGRTPEGVAQDFRKFVEGLRSRRPGVPVWFISIKPSVRRWAMWDRMQEANRRIADYAKTVEGVEVIDIAPVTLGPDGQPRPELFKADGLHLSREGEQAWAAVIRKRLQEKKK